MSEGFASGVKGLALDSDWLLSVVSSGHQGEQNRPQLLDESERRSWWAILAAAAVVIAVALLIAPSGRSEACTATSGGPEVCTQGTTSLLSNEGLWVLVPLSVPALAWLLPAILPARWTGQLVAAALLVFCFQTGFTIGLFILPLAVAALGLAF